MFQPISGSPEIDPSKFVDGRKLNMVDKLTCVGCTINRYYTIDDELSARVMKATNVFSTLNF